MEKNNEFMDLLLMNAEIERVDNSSKPPLLFHVDTREFKAEDVILPDGKTYEDSLSEERQELEKMLNKCSHLAERRSNHVFLFDEYSNALRYAGKVKGNIYEVTIEVSDICHKADMNKLDNILDIFRYTDNEDIRIAAAQEYWKDGTHTFSPCYEYLVKKCKVVRRVTTKTEAIDFHTRQIQNCRPIEQCSQYRKTINEIYSA